MTTPLSTGEQVRAHSWDQFVGQETLKRRLMTNITAARKAHRMLDHMLLIAPPGSGKTTLATLVAEQMNQDFADFMMPTDLKRFLWFVREWKGGVMLLDEIHRAPKPFQNSLLSIEQGYIENSAGRQISTRHITFICATTEPQLVIKPLWDRLPLKPKWEDYSDEEMTGIILGMAKRAKVTIPDEIATGLARATGGTPRAATKLVVACRDLASTGQDVSVDSILEQTGVDADGLTDQHLDYLTSIDALGGQTGLTNLCSMLQLSASVVEELERLLIRRRLVRLESSGRTLTRAGELKVPNQTKSLPSLERAS